VPDRLSASAHLPLICAAAVTPNGPPPLQLATATTLLWAGLELYDDLTDGDLSGSLKDRSDYEIVFTAFGLACLLPAALVTELEIPPACRAEMQRRMSGHLLRAFAGQQHDLRHVDGDSVTTAQVAEAVRGKNGEPSALFAALGALAAGAPPAVVEAYSRFGRALGEVAQYQSDFWELFHDEDSRDLRQGNRTYLVVSALELAEGHERAELLELLRQVRTDPRVAPTLRDILREARYVAPWREAVRSAATAGLDALESAAPADPAAGLLRRMIQERTPAC
jgi:geranylgeranyl pyrophosphate synthase